MGYSVRLESRTSRRTRLLFCTTGQAVNSTYLSVRWTCICTTIAASCSSVTQQHTPVLLMCLHLHHHCCDSKSRYRTYM